MVHLENLNQSLPPVRAEIILISQSWETRLEIIAAAKYLCIITSVDVI